MLATAKLQTLVLTSRIDAAERFYSQKLGLPTKGRSHGALLYDVGGADLRVSPVPDTRPSEHTVFGFAVDDLDAAMAWLATRGISWERFPGQCQDANGAVRTSEGARVAWFRDPDGNLLSVVQYAKEQPR